MTQNNLMELIRALRPGDWVGIPGIDPSWVGGLLRQIPGLVVTPMHCIRQGLPEPLTTGVAYQRFVAAQTNPKLEEEFGKHPVGSKILFPTKFRRDGVVFIEDYVIAVPSARFGSHAVLAIRQ